MAFQESLGESILSLKKKYMGKHKASKGGWYNLKMPDRVTLQLSSRTLVERPS